MSARHANNPDLELGRCACGRLPANCMVDQNGYRLFWIACECGAQTWKCESYGDAVQSWNEGDLLRNCTFQDGSGEAGMGMEERQ
jgi:hypothetical protein